MQVKWVLIIIHSWSWADFLDIPQLNLLETYAKERYVLYCMDTDSSSPHGGRNGSSFMP